MAKDNDEEKSSNKKDKPVTPVRTRNERRSSSKVSDKPDKRVKPVSPEITGKPSNTKPILPNKSRRTSTNNKLTPKQASSPLSNKPSSKQSLQASTPPSKPNKLPLSSPCNSTPPSKQATTPTGKAKTLLSRQSSKTSDSHKDKEPLEETKELSSECRKNGTVLKQDNDDSRRSYKHEDSLESDIDIDEEVMSPDSELAVDVVNSPGCMSDTSESRSDTRSDFGADEAFECSIGDKVQVKYGRGRNRRVYEAKVVTVDPDAEEGLLYLIHYAGWNIRYDEWISPDRIIGKSTKVSKRKGPPPKEINKNKLGPKPPGKQFMRSQSKRGTKSPSPASPGGKTSSELKNGNKISHRDSPPLQPCSPSSAKQTGLNGATTRRTRSDRNSFSSNGLDEAVKSPPSKRRQKSVTPEPEISKKPESQVILPEEKLQESHFEPIEEDLIKDEKPDSPDSEDSDDLKAEAKTNELTCHEKVNYNSKLRPWSKLPNGLITYSSSESNSPEHSPEENDPEPVTKKIKVEKELDKEEIAKLLGTNVEGKEPISAPHSQGSSTSDTQGGNTSSTHEDRQNSSSPVDSKQKASSSENNEGNKSNSSEADNSKDEKTDNKEETKTEKKDGDNRGKRHRKKKERKRPRHHSVNENSNDGCSTNASPSSKSSPTRPKISFNADLESIKSMEDGSERIRLLQMKINEMRKLYGSLKAEVASIDRRRKKLKKKREESSSHDSKSNCVSSPATVECR